MWIEKGDIVEKVTGLGSIGLFGVVIEAAPNIHSMLTVVLITGNDLWSPTERLWWWNQECVKVGHVE